MNLTIIILAHNEEKTIKKHVEDIKRKIINKIKKTELIIFHDGSRDSTHKILLQLKRKLKFRYIYKKKRMGVHLALHRFQDRKMLLQLLYSVNIPLTLVVRHVQRLCR